MKKVVAAIVAGAVINAGYGYYLNRTEGLSLPTMPVNSITPGAIKANCVVNDVGDRDVPESLKLEILDAYKLPRTIKRSKIRFDHRVPHALCGADSIENLWPEETKASYKKDAVERKMIILVRTNAMTIQQAQTCFMMDWRSCV